MYVYLSTHTQIYLDLTELLGPAGCCRSVFGPGYRGIMVNCTPVALSGLSCREQGLQLRQLE